MAKYLPFCRINKVPSGFIKIKVGDFYEHDKKIDAIFRIRNGKKTIVKNADEKSEVMGIRQKNGQFVTKGVSIEDIKKRTEIETEPAQRVTEAEWNTAWQEAQQENKVRTLAAGRAKMPASPTSANVAHNMGNISVAPALAPEPVVEKRQGANWKDPSAQQAGGHADEPEWKIFTNNEMEQLFSFAWLWYKRPKNKISDNYHGRDKDTTKDLIISYIQYGLMKKRVPQNLVPKMSTLMKMDAIKNSPELMIYYEQMLNEKQQKAEGSKFDSGSMSIGGKKFNIAKLPVALRVATNLTRLTARAGMAVGGALKGMYDRYQENKEEKAIASSMNAPVASASSSTGGETKEVKVMETGFGKLSKLLMSIDKSLKPKDTEAKDTKGNDSGDVTEKVTTKESKEKIVEKEKKSNGMFGLLASVGLVLMGLAKKFAALLSPFKLLFDALNAFKNGIGSILKKMIEFATMNLRLPSAATLTSLLKSAIAGIIAVNVIDAIVKKVMGEATPITAEEKEQDKNNVKHMSTGGVIGHTGQTMFEGALRLVGAENTADLYEHERIADVKWGQEWDANPANKNKSRAERYEAHATWKANNKSDLAKQLAAVKVEDAKKKSEELQATSKEKATEIQKTQSELKSEIKSSDTSNSQNSTQSPPIIIPSEKQSGQMYNPSRVNTDSIIYEYLFKTARPSFIG